MSEGQPTFQHIGWRFNTSSPDDQQRLCDELRGVCCEALNLCASVACQCVTGVNEVLCHEADTGGVLPIVHSQGPMWSVSVTRLRASVLLDVYFEAPTVAEEIRNLHVRLVSYGIPVFQSSSGASRL